jgi:hypothetical protein
MSAIPLPSRGPVAGSTAYLVRSAGQPRAPGAGVRTAPGWLEFAAGGLLWLSVGLVTAIFWDGPGRLIEPATGISAGRDILLLGTAFLLYGVFYLPCRYLFLVEDHRSVLTWVRVSVAMLPAVWLVIVG